MEKHKHWSSGHVYNAKHHFAGLPDEYTNSVSGVTHVIGRLLHEFVTAGGDLTRVQISVSDEMSLGRRHMTVTLHGYGA